MRYWNVQAIGKLRGFSNAKYRPSPCLERQVAAKTFSGWCPSENASVMLLGRLGHGPVDQKRKKNCVELWLQCRSCWFGTPWVLNCNQNNPGCKNKKWKCHSPLNVAPETSSFRKGFHTAAGHHFRWGCVLGFPTKMCRTPNLLDDRI